jgi:acyl-CoA thioester hydrolase
MKPRSFRKPKGSYIKHSVTVGVRFQEVDSLRIVWHGNYASYFEDGRTAFGDEYAISYTDILDAGLIAPVVHLSCDYIKPATFGQRLKIKTSFYKRESPKLEFHYEIADEETGDLLTTGMTVQVLMDPQKKLIMTMPQFLRDFYSKWHNYEVYHSE